MSWYAEGDNNILTHLFKHFLTSHNHLRNESIWLNIDLMFFQTVYILDVNFILYEAIDTNLRQYSFL